MAVYEASKLQALVKMAADDTIEEKIAALQKTKRVLADSLLKDAGISGNMSAEALLKMIQ